MDRALLWLDRAAALALAGSALVQLGTADDRPDGPLLAATAVILVCATLPVAWRRVAPLAAMAVASLTLIVATFVEETSSAGGGQAFAAFVLLLYSSAAHAERRPAIAGLALGFGVVAAHHVHQLLQDESTGDFPNLFLLVTAVWLFGRVVRWRTSDAARLTREAERERADAITEERTRIARELHDVVAHSVSVMVVQAQAGQRVLEGEQPSARESLETIEHTGREALVELRRLLGMLRPDDEELALVPQPSLQYVDQLAARVREAGLPVDVTVEGEPRALPPGIDLSAYRIVQEALTNALKHSGRARARVTVRYGADEIELEVTDDGRGPAGGNGGHGLAGMRERVSVYGGTLESGGRAGEGYSVRARLPL